MLLTSICAVIILLLIEHGLFGRITSYVLSLIKRPLPTFEDDRLDDDVKEIKERLNAMTISELREQNLILRNVSKFYGNFLAVNQVSLEIKR